MSDLLRRLGSPVVKLFSCQHMLKSGEALGELPSTKAFYQRVLQMAWPSALESMLVSLIGAIDTMMVGSLGAEAIAAVGITNQPKFIVLAFIFSLNFGVTACVSRRKGEDNRDGANRCMRQAIVISFCLSLVLSIVGFIFAQEVVTFAGAQSDTVADATIYFRILLTGMVFTAVTLTINAAQRGAGNTKISMKTNVTANIVNVIFNYLLIGGNLGFPRWGVAGAAVATTLGNFVALCMAIRSITSKRSVFLRLQRGDSWKFDRETLSGIVKVSSSSMVEQVFMRIGFFTYVKLVASLGTVAFATHQICMNILNFSFAAADGLGIATSALVGQSLGAKRPDKAIIFGKTGQRVGLAVATLMFLIFILGQDLLIELFSKDPQIIAMGAQIMIVIAFTCHIQITQVVISGCLRGAGDTFFVAMSSLVSIMVIRPIVTWILCYPLGWGLIGAWISLLADQLIRMLANYWRFGTGKWTQITL